MSQVETEGGNENKDNKIEIKENDDDKTPKRISFNIYNIILKCRSNHGVPTEDYDVYRKYLSKQLSILRKKLNLQCIDPKNNKDEQFENAKKNKLKRERLKKIKSGKLKPKRDPNWNPKYKKYPPKKEITWQNRKICIDDLYKNDECLLILLYLCERAWAFSKAIYEEYDEDHKRKYHHSNSRLRKSIVFAKNLYKLLIETNDLIIIDDKTKLESFGYLSWLQSSYYLQTEQLLQSYKEYLKCMKITSMFNENKILFLENNEQMNINTKLTYFNECIKKQQRIEIEKSVNEEIKKLKQTLNIIDNDDEDEMKGGQNTKNGGKKEKEDIVFIEYNQNKIVVPDIGGLCKLIKSLHEEIDNFDKIMTGNKNLFKKQNLFTKIVIIIDKSLEIIQKEVKKFNNSSIQDSSANTYLIINKYLEFEKFRFYVMRQYLYFQNCLSIKTEKNKNKNKNKKFLYELAVLSERQIRYLDDLSTCTDLTNYANFVKEIEILRDLFEISRKYFIAKIYYFIDKNYINSYQIFEHHIISAINDFITNFDYKKQEKYDKKYSLSHYVDINEAKNIIENILNDSKKLLILSKANYILNGKNQNNNNNDNDNKNDDDLTLIDMNRKLYPLLSKPVMIDVAWNFIDYNQMDDDNNNNNNNNKKNDNNNNTKNKPKEPQKQQSWFGGFFGQ